MRNSPWYAALAVSLVFVCAAPAHAQLYEDVGTRAQGMAGAFVAVADDATATWWNPAGLSTGMSLFDVVVGKSRTTQPESPTGIDPARRSNTGAFAATFPSLGLSYYRLRISQVAPIATIEPAGQDRQVLGGIGRVRSLALNQFGATFGQSLGEHFVIGTTLKFVQGGVASAIVDGTTDALDVGDDLDMAHQTRGDLDVGAMVKFQRIRFGATVRNVRQPVFDAGDQIIALTRQARGGVAVLSNPKNTAMRFTISADADFTTMATPLGDVRHAALGGELWMLGQRLGVRGGWTVNTVGLQRRTTSTGVSVAVMKGLFIEGAKTFGADDSIRCWSSSVRFTF